MLLKQLFSQWFGKATSAAVNTPAASSEEASLRFLAELQQCCAALPKGRAEVVFADQEFHISMRWHTDEATPQPSSKALAFWINGENLDVDYQELPWESTEMEATGDAVKTNEKSEPSTPSAPIKATDLSQQAAVKEEVESRHQEEEKTKSTPRQRAVREMKSYLLDHYAFRYNCISARTEYAPLVGEQVVGPYKAVLTRVQNRLSQEVINEGIPCNDHDVKRFVESENAAIPTFHPFLSFMKNLPEWDGEDRVTPLAQRISTQTLWVRGFHRWMLAMAAQWMEMPGERVQANNVMPLLVSDRQGLGKSTFCRRLLPEELRAYYTDTYDLSGKSNMVSRLISFGLVNLDEFDQIPASRMAKLKNILQSEDQHYRRPYSRSEEYLPRIASFIGTSNRHDLLTDLTGSRRFLCVEVTNVIDRSPIDYAQLYAQLKYELLHGERCWFSKEEEAEIQMNNHDFYTITPAEEVVREHVTFATEEEDGACFCSASALYTQLKKRHASALHDCSPLAFSKMLAQMAPRVHTRYGNGYWVKLD